MVYGTTGYRKFLDQDGYPANAPPWGTLNAINLDTGEYVWKVTLGQYPELTAKGLPDTGSENYGGPVVTSGGLLFIGATVLRQKVPGIRQGYGQACCGKRSFLSPRTRLLRHMRSTGNSMS